jgi:hypothetical protein
VKDVVLTKGNMETLAGWQLTGFDTYKVEAFPDRLEIMAEANGKSAYVVWPINELTPEEVESAARSAAKKLKEMTHGR